MLVARDVWAAPPGVAEPVVRGASLTLARGEWLTIEGPNGGGKTTLALVLAGLRPARRGTVEFDGETLGPGAPAVLREGIAVVLQEPASQLLQPTVAEEIAFGGRNLGRPPEALAAAVTTWARRLGLEADLGRDPRALSAGRQQLVILAGALACGPRLLVADEPGAHLDQESRRRALEVVGEEVGRGLAVVWVTQDDSERAASHRTLCLSDPEPVPALRAPPAAGAADRALTLRVAFHGSPSYGPSRADTLVAISGVEVAPTLVMSHAPSPLVKGILFSLLGSIWLTYVYAASRVALVARDTRPGR